MRVEKTLKLKLHPLTSEDRILLYDLLSKYKRMLRLAVDVVFSKDIRSVKRAHEELYQPLRKMFSELHNKYAEEAYKKALSMYKSYRKLMKKFERGLLKSSPSKPEPEADIVDLHISAFRIEVRKRFAIVKVSYGNGRRMLFAVYDWRLPKMLSEGWKPKNSRIVIDNGIWLHLVISKDFEIKEGENVLAIDINEESVDCALYIRSQQKLIFLSVRHDIKQLRMKYRAMREKVQKKLKDKPRERDKVLARYGRRERNRVDDRTRKLTTLLAEIARKFNATLVREKLEFPRKRTRNRSLNYRLNVFCYRKIIANLDYKLFERGLKVIEINPKGTSITCPICGYKDRKNRVDVRKFRCKKCGFEFDAQFVACLNLLRSYDGVAQRSRGGNFLRWVPRVVGTTASDEVLIDDVLRGKPRVILAKLAV